MVYLHIPIEKIIFTFDYFEALGCCGTAGAAAIRTNDLFESADQPTKPEV